jgi:hypothetical protein
VPLSAEFSVDGSSAVQAHEVAYGATVDLALLSLTGVRSIQWSIGDPDSDGSSAGTSHSSMVAPTITPAGAPTGATASFTMVADPGDGEGRACVVKCKVTDSGGNTAVAYRVVGVPNTRGYVPFVVDEALHRNATHGWTEEINSLLAGISTMPSVVDPDDDDKTIVLKDGVYNKVSAVVRHAGLHGFLPAASAATNVAALNTLITAVNALGGGTIVVPDGDYDCDSGAIVLKSNVHIHFAPNAVLDNPYFTATGTVGSEIVFDAPADRGASTIELDTATLDNGDWLRIASIVHAFSADAAEWQLGHQENYHNYLAEFVRVADASDPAEATLLNSTIFPYSNTPGADTDAGFANQVSVALKVTFVENVRVKGLRTRGKQALPLGPVHLTYCRDVVFEDCELIADEDESTILFRLTHCLDCHARGGRIVGRRTNIPGTSAANPVLFETCQGCTLNDVTIEGGFQGLDITWVASAPINRGGPSIACGAINCRAYGTNTDGFTSHDGNYANFFRGCTVFGSHFGIRIRSRADEISNCLVIGGGGDVSDAGLYVYQGAAVDCNVHDNIVQGTRRGLMFDLRSSLFASDYFDLFELIGNNAHIHNNKIYDCASHGILVELADTTAVSVGPRLINNEVHRPGADGDGIRVRAYNNGTIIKGLYVYGLQGTNAAIRYEANIKRLHIDDVHCYGGAVGAPAISGPSAATFLTDATTFPAGEAEAFLHIGAVYTDAATPSEFVIQDADAYLRPHWAGLSNRTYVDVFTANGTWTKRLGALTVKVFLVGEGGPGGSGAKYGAGVQCGGGGGGGAAAVLEHTFLASGLSDTVAVTATAAGKGGASQSTNSSDGKAGSGQVAAVFGAYLTAGNGSAGGGGTNAAGGTAGSSSSGDPEGSAGGAGGFGAAGSAGSTAFNGGASGGGGGGGLSAADGEFDGGAGGGSRFMTTTSGAAGGKAGGTVAGTDGVTLGVDACAQGGGGGGGASSKSGNAGKGGAGGKYGAGGGGGGAARNDTGDSGEGGAGGAPLCVAITYCE